MGQNILGFGERDGKMYYKIQKDISIKYSGTGRRVIVTLGPTAYSKGPVLCSGVWAQGVQHMLYFFLFKVSLETVKCTGQNPACLFIEYKG